MAQSMSELRRQIKRCLMLTAVGFTFVIMGSLLVLHTPLSPVIGFVYVVCGFIIMIPTYRYAGGYYCELSYRSKEGE